MYGKLIYYRQRTARERKDGAERYRLTRSPLVLGVNVEGLFLIS